MHVDELAHAVSVVFCRSALSDFDLTPGSMHVEEDEQIGRSIALILAVETFELAWSGRDRPGHPTHDVGPTLRRTDHPRPGSWPFRLRGRARPHAGGTSGAGRP